MVVADVVIDGSATVVDTETDVVRGPRRMDPEKVFGVTNDPNQTNWKEKGGITNFGTCCKGVPTAWFHICYVVATASQL
jgi:hypothetical protein